MTLLRRSLVQAADSHCSTVVVSGRCLVVNLVFDSCIAQFAKRHLEPSAFDECKQDLLR